MEHIEREFMDDYKMIKQHKYTKQLLNYKRTIIIAIYFILIYKYITVIKFSKTLSKLPFDKFHFNSALYIMVVISVIVYLIDIINLSMLKGRGIKNTEYIVIIVTILTFNTTIKSNVVHIISLMIGVISICLVVYRKNKVNKQLVDLNEPKEYNKFIKISTALLIAIVLSKIGTLGILVLTIMILIYVLIKFANYNYSYIEYLEKAEYNEAELDLLLNQYEQKHGKLK